MGALLATTGTWLAQALMEVVELAVLHRIGPFSWTTLRLALAAVASTATVAAVPMPSSPLARLLVASAAVMVIYAVVILLVKGTTGDDARALRALVQSRRGRAQARPNLGSGG
jgi:O-antigen/teichoic acid export membrane protein